jgi:RNA polymerase sigma factor (sigma-70 family)
MAGDRATVILEHIRRFATTGQFEHLTDRELLGRFANHRDEAAFSVVLGRHGSMVFRVCQRILHHIHDAEDVYQATFLVLAQKAPVLCWHESVASWLYQVAQRLALKAKNTASHRTDPRRVAQRAVDDPAHELTLREAQALLDAELNRLSPRHRLPLILCYLEGATRDEAATQLGWSLSTLKRRLERGMELLRRRLTRQGLAPAAILATSLLMERATSAAVLSSAWPAACRRTGSLWSATAAALRAAKRFAGPRPEA